MNTPNLESEGRRTEADSRGTVERRVIRKGTEEQSRYVGGQVSSMHLGPKETTSDP